jgi:hypothetical protein
MSIRAAKIISMAASPDSVNNTSDSLTAASNKSASVIVCLLARRKLVEAQLPDGVELGGGAAGVV